MRQCGECTLCCKLVPVEELRKPAGKRCKHQRFHRGCMIYAARPVSCREWSCMWLIGTEEEGPLPLSRPDRAGYVIDVVPDIIRATNNETGEVTQIDVMQIWCDPARPNAWRDPALLDMLERQGIIGLVRYNSEEGFTLWPPSRNSAGKWQKTDTQSAEDLRGAQAAARFAFWQREASVVDSGDGNLREARVPGGHAEGAEDRAAARSLDVPAGPERDRGHLSEADDRERRADHRGARAPGRQAAPGAAGRNLKIQKF